MTSNPYRPPERDNSDTHVKLRTRSLWILLTQSYGILTAASYAALVLAALAIYLALMSGYSGTLPGGYVMPYSELLRSFLNLGAFGLMGLTVLSSVQVCRFGTTAWRLVALPTAIMSSSCLLFWAVSLLEIWASWLLDWAVANLF